jgi:hypothetical protein
MIEIKVSHRRCLLGCILCILVLTSPIVFHFLWNSIGVAAGLHPASLLQSIIIYACIVFIICFFKNGLKNL